MPEQPRKPHSNKPPHAVHTVALVLAVAIALALLIMTFPVIWAIIHHDSEPSRLVAITQVLTGWGGGVLSLLSAYIGYNFGYTNGRKANPDAQD